MKATLLEQMKRDYIHIKHTKTVTRQQVERQEEVLYSTLQCFHMFYFVYNSNSACFIYFLLSTVSLSLSLCPLPLSPTIANKLCSLADNMFVYCCYAKGKKQTFLSVCSVLRT